MQEYKCFLAENLEENGVDFSLQNVKGSDVAENS